MFVSQWPDFDKIVVCCLVLGENTLMMNAGFSMSFTKIHLISMNDVFYFKKTDGRVDTLGRGVVMGEREGHLSRAQNLWPRN
jgi:hypothetical protein